ncbi:hypothetical protein MP638_003033 [Amoeboaphelidium occidentale]|nr:hypothetical protein MP638_003033 [Amoeboaphelidium occidentale]
MEKKIAASANIESAFVPGVPGTQRNYAATTIKKKKSFQATSDKSAELASFETKAQITAALIKSLFSLSTEFLNVLMKSASSAATISTAAAADANKDQLIDFEGKVVNYTKDLLQKLADILSTLKIYKDDQAMWDSLLRPINSLVTTTVNIKPRFYDEEKTDLKVFITLTSQKLQDIVKNLLSEIRLVVATQLSHVHYAVLSTGKNTLEVDNVGSAKVFKTVKVISTLRRYLLNKTDSDVIMKGNLAKKVKGDASLSKNWKKCYFNLDNDKLMYADKEADNRTTKTLFTSSFVKVEDSSAENQKPFTFTIHADYPLVLSASTEQEYNDWIMKLKEVIRNNRNIKADSAENKNKQVEVDWAVFKESELRDLLKSYDREEKYLTETTKILYLQKMTEIIQKLQKIDPSSKVFVPEISALDSKSQEYAEIQQRRSKMQQMPTEEKDFLVVVKNDPAAYLAEIIGFGINDFSIQ